MERQPRVSTWVLGAAIATELMIGFWFGIGVMPPHQSTKYHKGWIGEILQH